MKKLQEYINLVEANTPQGYDPTSPAGWDWIKQGIGNAADAGERYFRQGARDASIAKAHGQTIMPSDPTHPSNKPTSSPTANVAGTPTSGGVVSTSGWDQKPATSVATAPAQAQAASPTPAAGQQSAEPSNWEKFKTWATTPVFDFPWDKQGQPGQPGQAPSTTNPAQPAAQAGGSSKGWPTSKQEIVNFQKANGLKPDGLIGWRTEQALIQKGIQPPAGFKPVADRPGASQQPAQASAQPAQASASVPGASASTTAPASNNIQDLLNKAAQLTAAGDTAKAKIYTDTAARLKSQATPAKPAQSQANANLHQQMRNLQPTLEGSELDRILKLAKVK